VAEVGMGKAGIVLGLEVSRLARNNADWHRLLEICALTDTLILDEDGVYDPGILTIDCCSIKRGIVRGGTPFPEARLQGGIMNKARRGELQCVLPASVRDFPFHS